tara:strand:+ start:8247 stop:9650 length:1404 start_codon:yes stop_codon:yes gene_type:complete
VSGYSFVVEHDVEAFERWSGVWLELQKQSADPYLSPSWYRLWWSCFGAGAELMLLVVDSPGRAIVPLMLRDGTLSFVGNIYSHRHQFVSEISMEIVWELVFALASSLDDCQRVVLSHLDAEGLELRALRSFSESPWQIVEGEREAWARPKEGWEAYLHARGGAARRKRKKVRRRLDEYGQWELSSSTTPAQAKTFVREYMSILNRSWKAPELSRSFFRKLCQQTAECGHFRSYTLYIDGRPVACQMGFLKDGTYFCYKTAFDDLYRILSPGIAVMELAFEDVIGQGARAIDLLTGAGAYKDLWCGDQRIQCHVLWGADAEMYLPCPPAKDTTHSEDVRYVYSSERLVLPDDPVEGVFLCPVDEEQALSLSVLMGHANLSKVTEWLRSDEHQGVMCVRGERIVDVIWCRKTDGELRVSFAENACSSFAERLQLWSAVQKRWGKGEYVSIAPLRMRGVFKKLGFVLETQ